MNDKSVNTIAASEAKTLAGLFRERVARTPDAVAYRQYDPDNRRWYDASWADMATEVARWQSALAKESLDHGDRVSGAGVLNLNSKADIAAGL